MSFKMDEFETILCQEKAKKERDEMFQTEPFYYEEFETILRQEKAKQERDEMLSKLK
jgi:hypothetical protein